MIIYNLNIYKAYVKKSVKFCIFIQNLTYENA